MQDGERAHTTNFTRKWFIDMDIYVMDWHAFLQQFNPGENLCAEMTRKVYKNGRRYQTVEQLKYTVLQAWDGILEMEETVLFYSMTSRCVAGIQVREKTTKYWEIKN